MERVMKELNRLSAMVGDEFDIPVEVNGRLTKTLGRVFSESHNDVWLPVKMEFSRKFLETATEQSLLATVQHEWAHYYVTKSTGENHGHDAVFKAMCARIGCTADKTKTKVDRIVAETEVYKYTVNCPECDFMHGYSRMCPTLRNIHLCRCPKCGSGKLKAIQNW